jgi:hypothetical protein
MTQTTARRGTAKAGIARNIEAKDAALRAARDLITNLRQQDFESFTVAGVAETMDADEAGIIAKYDAFIAQIDGALNG